MKSFYLLIALDKETLVATTGNKNTLQLLIMREQIPVAFSCGLNSLLESHLSCGTIKSAVFHV